MKFKKTSILSLALALALVIGVTTAFATNAAPADDGKEVPLNELVAITGEVGDEIGGIRMIVHDSQFVDLADLEYVEGDCDLAGLSYNVDSNGKWPMVYIPENHKDSSESGTVALEQLERLDAKELENMVPMEMSLISVSHDDEHKFTPERWAQILRLIDEGKVSWED